MTLRQDLKNRIGKVGVAGALGSQPYELQREVAAHVEELGFAALWYGEAFGREALVQGALFLAATTRLVVASGIASIYARDAFATAFGGMALAEAFGDRFVLGLGISHRQLVERRGHEYEKPVAAMGRYLDLLDRAEQMWSGPTAPTAPRVLAALGPRMLALAAARAAGAMSYFVDVTHTQKARGILGPSGLLAPEIAVFRADDRAAARRVANAYMGVYVRLPNYRNNLVRLGWGERDLEGDGSDALFDAVVAWGDAEAITDRVAEHQAAGADDVVLNLQVSDFDLEYRALVEAVSRSLRARSLL